MNKHRVQLNKGKLDVGDICKITIEGNIRVTTRAKYLPAAVMELATLTNRHIIYKIATRNGFPKSKYQCQQMHYMPMLTNGLLMIDEMNETVFHRYELTEQTAVSLYSMISAKEKCKCKTDCGASGSKCICNSKGIFCTSKCHGGRGSR